MPQPGPRFTATLRRPADRRLIACRHCGYQGRLLKAHVRLRWFYLPAGFLLGCTGIGIVPLALLVFYLGRLTWPACPACGARSGLASWRGQPSAEADRKWRRAVEEDRREFLRTKLALMAVLAVVAGTLLLYLLIRLWF